MTEEYQKPKWYICELFRVLIIACDKYRVWHIKDKFVVAGEHPWQCAQPQVALDKPPLLDSLASRQLNNSTVLVLLVFLWPSPCCQTQMLEFFFGFLLIYLEYTQIVCCSPFFVSIAPSVSSAKYQWLQKISVACWMASMLVASMLVASMLQVSILVASVAAKDICWRMASSGFPIRL